MLHFFNYLRLPATSPLVENQISRRNLWPCWSVCSLLLTGMTRQERRAGRYRGGWCLSDHCGRCPVSGAFLVVGVAEEAAEEIVAPLAWVGGDDGPQRCVVHHSKPGHSPNPRNHRRTWSLREVQSTNLPRLRHPHVRKTCWGCMAPPVPTI